MDALKELPYRGGSEEILQALHIEPGITEVEGGVLVLVDTNED
jgi:hypothetical protein